uniref:Serine (or cysteine) proteinase inhibitor, clade A, member 3K n=1 Tax=Xenopus tropicalis TaxID=8364 RepID=A0A803JPS5_XENTR
MYLFVYLSLFIALTLASVTDISLNKKQGNKQQHHHDNPKHCHQKDKQDQTWKAEGKLTKDKEVLSEENYDFTFNLFNELSAECKRSPKQNIFFSPISISAAFYMLALGAKSKTHQQILQGLGFNKKKLNESQVHEAFKGLIEDLNNPMKDHQFTIGNALFVEQTVNILRGFEENVKHYYQAAIFPINFRDPDNAKKQLNNYVKDKTHGAIQEMVRDLDANTEMVLVNYVLFKGEWESPFSPDFTRLSVFSIDNRTKVEVKMMSRMGRFDIFLDNELPCTVLKLPYIDDALMLLIMPELGKIQEVEAALSKDTILRWRNSTSKKFLRLYMPKFSISSSLKLKEILSDVGMSNIFSDQADFSGIVEDGKLTLSKVIHKAVLDVDEKGTEAAAVTAVNVIRYSLLKSQKVDRPFLVVICSKQTDTILFMGRIVNPTEK